MLTEFASLKKLTMLPLPMRRRALRMIWRTQRVAGRAPNFGIDGALRYALRVSGAEALRLQAEVGHHDMLSVLEWASIVMRSRAALEADARSISFDNVELLQQLSRARAPLIFAPLHMGCFALPFAKMMRDYFADRPMLILRAREDQPEETLAMRRIVEIGVDMRFLNIKDKTSYFDAIKFARNGAIIVNFVDLPASYGGAVCVNLFGRPAKLAMGVGSLARLTGGTVVPLSVQSFIQGDTVRFGKPFESYETGNAEKARVTRLVRNHIEQSILAAPDQWHMWPRFEEFLDSDQVNEAA